MTGAKAVKGREKSLARQMIDIIRRRPFIMPQVSAGDGKEKARPKFYLKKIEYRVPRRVGSFLRYPLIYPFAYADIRFNPVREKYIYHVVEPPLSKADRDNLERIKDGLLQVIDISLTTSKNREKLLEYLEERFRFVTKRLDMKLTAAQYYNYMYYIYRDFVGLNRIEPLMNDRLIEDIGCDGVGIPVYVVHRKFGSIETNIIYESEDELVDFVIKLAERCNRYISYAHPLLDGSLPDGSRVQATLTSEVTTHGPTFSIRKFKEVPMTFTDLIAFNSLSAEMLAYLWLAVENGMNMLLVGGVSTGKTTLLNAISLFIPQDAKIVSIEDTRELNLPHENWIPSVARSSFSASGIGEVTMFDLLKASFRQNPDYIIVGEIRGKEASVLFQAMSSGHPSIATMHGTNIEGVVKRLETPPIELPVGLIESLDMVVVLVHAREKGKSARRVKEIDELVSIDPTTGNVDYVKSFVWDPAKDVFNFTGKSMVLKKIMERKGFSREYIDRELEDRRRVIEWMAEMNIVDWKIIARYVALYQVNKKRMMEIIGR